MRWRWEQIGPQWAIIREPDGTMIASGLRYTTAVEMCNEHNASLEHATHESVLSQSAKLQQLKAQVTQWLATSPAYYKVSHCPQCKADDLARRAAMKQWIEELK